MTDLALGMIVRAVYPNARWGMGIVIGCDDRHARLGLKPITVQRSDGEIGYFSADQVEEIDPATMAPREQEPAAEGIDCCPLCGTPLHPQMPEEVPMCSCDWDVRRESLG